MNALGDLIMPEGWRPVGAAVAAALLLAFLDLELFAFLGLVAALLLVWVYRKSVRTVSHFEKGSVTSPCDGRVTAIDTKPDGSVVVEIETGCLDGSLLTVPLEGSVTHCSVVRGARLGRSSTLFERLNEHGTIYFEDAGGKHVGITHTLKSASAPLVLDQTVRAGRHMRGQRYGVLVQGITRVFLPASTRVAVNPGEHVSATETLLGYMG